MSEGAGSDPGWVYHEAGPDGTGHEGWLYQYADGGLVAEDGTAFAYDATGAAVPADEGADGSTLFSGGEHPHGGTTSERRHELGVRLLVLVVVVLSLLVGLGLVRSRDDGERASRQSSPLTGFDPPATVPVDSEYVVSHTLPSGELAVDHWIRSARRNVELDLSVPRAPTRDRAAGAPAVRVRDLAVQTETGTLRRADTTRPGPRTFVFPGTPTLHVSYVLSGVVERSGSAPGRALLRLTSLDLRFTHDRVPKTVVVTGGRLRAAACQVRGTADQPRPCGRADADGWRVDLQARARSEVVSAQLDLGRAP